MLKYSKATQFGCALVLGLGLFMVPQVSSAGSQDYLVTDPDTLEAMGFERDAENVYMAPGVDLEGAFGDLLSSAGDLEAQTNLFASGSTDYSPVSAKEFIGRRDTNATDWLYTTSGNSFDLSRLGSERFADAQVTDLPNGGTLQFLRWWWSDNDPASGMGIFVFEVCQPAFAGGAITHTTIATDVSFDILNGSRAIVIPARTIDTQACTYIVRVRFDAVTTALLFQKARLQFTHP